MIQTDVLPIITINRLFKINPEEIVDELGYKIKTISKRSLGIIELAANQILFENCFKQEENEIRVYEAMSRLRAKRNIILLDAYVFYAIQYQIGNHGDQFLEWLCKNRGIESIYFLGTKFISERDGDCIVGLTRDRYRKGWKKDIIYYHQNINRTDMIATVPINKKFD